ncbi:MAG: hypothetical protein JW782_02695 [Candidatus Saganbacteria bacterium]|nr:hypothetical protein [Candidatus Saganbacteria bacterium]
MKITALPRLRHTQRLNQPQAERFFKAIRQWLAGANRKVADLKNADQNRNHVDLYSSKIRRALSEVQHHLDYLRAQGFQNEGLERELAILAERLDQLEDRAG